MGSAKGREVVENMSKNYLKEAFIVALGLISAIWLLNFNLGIFEIPDVLPIVGHIDEVTAFLIFDAFALRYFKFSPTGVLNKFVNKGR